MPTFFTPLESIAPGIPKDPVIYQAPDPAGLIAENGGARLPVGTTFSGHLVQNDMVHIDTDIGFVQASDVLGPCSTYQITQQVPIREAPDPASLIAENGTAVRHPGDTVDALSHSADWLWIISGIGFIPTTSAQKLRDIPASYPGVGRIHILQPGESLSSLADFYYHDESRWRELAAVNHIDENDVSTLPDGLRLIIPKE